MQKAMAGEQADNKRACSQYTLVRELQCQPLPVGMEDELCGLHGSNSHDFSVLQRLHGPTWSPGILAPYSLFSSGDAYQKGQDQQVQLRVGLASDIEYWLFDHICHCRLWVNSRLDTRSPTL